MRQEGGFLIYESGDEKPETKRDRPGRYPFDKLKVGEAMLVEGKTAKSMASTVSSAQRRTGFKLSASTTSEGVLITRIG